MRSADIDHGVRLYAWRLRDQGEILTKEEKRHLVDVLTRVDEAWEVHVDSHGMRFAWNEYGSRIRPGCELTPQALDDLARAVGILNESGLRVIAGRSARGFTYLNIDDGRSV